MNESQYIEIIKRIQAGEKPSLIAIDFKVSRQAIYAIKQKLRREGFVFVGNDSVYRSAVRKIKSSFPQWFSDTAQA